MVVLPNLTVVNNASLTSSAWSAPSPKAFKDDVKISAAAAAEVTPPTASLVACSNTIALSDALLKPAETISYLAFVKESKRDPMRWLHLLILCLNFLMFCQYLPSLKLLLLTTLFESLQLI